MDISAYVFGCVDQSLINTSLQAWAHNPDHRFHCYDRNQENDYAMMDQQDDILSHLVWMLRIANAYSVHAFSHPLINKTDTGVDKAIIPIGQWANWEYREILGKDYWIGPKQSIIRFMSLFQWYKQKRLAMQGGVYVSRARCSLINVLYVWYYVVWMFTG